MNFVCKELLPHKSDNFLYDVLRARGIDDPDDYLNAGPQDMTDGWLLDNMDRAVSAVHDLIEGTDLMRNVVNGIDSRNVVITVDPDADGFTSAAIMWLYLDKVDTNHVLKKSYVLHNGKQHGTDDLIEKIENYCPDLLIVPDAGSSEFEVHETYKKAHPETTIIVLDHHLCDNKEDPYCIRVNNQISERFPNKTLCGAGIVYKFCQCYDDKYGFNYADDFIDLAAVGLVGDMMDLRNKETHYIVSKGLSNITNEGLMAFVRSFAFSLNNRTQLTPTDVAFYIAPAINAVVRVATQDTKAIIFESLLHGNNVVPSTKRGAEPNDTEILGEQAARLARNAKAAQDRLVEKALDNLEFKIAKNGLLENKILVVPVDSSDNIHSSLTGLIAMKLTSKYHRPTLILRECEDGYLRGSARAENGTEIKEFKTYLDNTNLVNYAQGHAQAFGVGIKASMLDDFIAFTNNDLAAVDFNEKAYEVDYLFNENEDLTQIISDLSEGTSLYGQDIKEPILGVQNIPLSSKDVVVMKNNCMKFTHNGVSYVIFKNADAIENFTKYDRMIVSVCGRANLNEYLGRTTPQVLITAYEVKNEKYVF